MKSKLLHHEAGLKTFALVFDKGDEIREGRIQIVKNLVDHQVAERWRGNAVEHDGQQVARSGDGVAQAIQGLNDELVGPGP